MKHRTKITTRLAAVAGLALSVAPVNATVIISAPFSGSFTEVSNSNEQFYSGDQSGSDLLKVLTATSVSGWRFENGADPAELNDGIHGDFPPGDAEGAWTTVGAVVEYNFGPNALGYDITGIQSIASWAGVGFGNQVWTVEVKPVGGDYALLATVDYTPFNLLNGNLHPDSAGASKVNLTGLDATGIEFIRFTAGSTLGNSVDNQFVWREIDVFGIATVPEPSSTALLGLAALAVALRRRRV